MNDLKIGDWVFVNGTAEQLQSISINSRAANDLSGSYGVITDLHGCAPNFYLIKNADLKKRHLDGWWISRKYLDKCPTFRPGDRVFITASVDVLNEYGIPIVCARVVSHKHAIVRSVNPTGSLNLGREDGKTLHSSNEHCYENCITAWPFEPRHLRLAPVLETSPEYQKFFANSPTKLEDLKSLAKLLEKYDKELLPNSTYVLTTVKSLIADEVLR